MGGRGRVRSRDRGGGQGRDQGWDQGRLMTGKQPCWNGCWTQHEAMLREVEILKIRIFRPGRVLGLFIKEKRSPGG